MDPITNKRWSEKTKEMEWTNVGLDGQLKAILFRLKSKWQGERRQGKDCRGKCHSKNPQVHSLSLPISMLSNVVLCQFTK